MPTDQPNDQQQTKTPEAPEANQAPQPPAPPAPEPVDAKAAEKAQKDAEAQAAREHAKHMREVEAQIKEMELRVAHMNLQKTEQSLDDFKDTQESKKRKAQAAQDALNELARNEQNKRNACRHRTGGFGVDQFLRGDGKASVVAQQLPIAGMQMIICTRCGEEWTTPNPNLRKSDPEKYLEQLRHYEKGVQLLADSYNSQPLGCPTFQFDKGGIPVMPEIR